MDDALQLRQTEDAAWGSIKPWIELQMTLRRFEMSAATDTQSCSKATAAVNAARMLLICAPGPHPNMLWGRAGGGRRVDGAAELRCNVHHTAFYLTSFSGAKPQELPFNQASKFNC
jgi:hypothetical protein